ncbi:glycosyltransferase family 2 protein [Psychroserpens sp.]|uniref:glycosyltransferase family 2 protein n=1 Tax=Psychroserpens sp. TaxID=2020870 RepID=UPI001B0852BF|nr:glycosyltransferase family 2 protein [Psychroserpens sp.]MBO6605717.1 glycosyltransferase family 2 protein [Psychroserpens sp.]MBO6630297.1 glycosyltransferase family 2 protein [Psychroserpens sp.]MBO6652912.1 glycosyltransferase family 2 protein [Psychroserpens sp.]MBO6681316.1 glycosyltransferase family 2 protein [Psychroserpens sp.]MBO6749091.1 glycosyltransferase family 2 protein [Psychroserpens sp.]
MEFLKLLFWILLIIVFYTYIGYGIILYVLVRIKRAFTNSRNDVVEITDYPELTLLIPAFNERDYVEKKMRNTMNLDYPKEKLKIVWVTDGSTDGTNKLLESYDNIKLFHNDERKGKINAMNRVMPFVKSELVVFTDANTELGKDSLKHIARCFSDPKVGCVSGEKRIVNHSSDAAAGAGEGLYWRYESTLKKWDAELYSAVGAAGELFAIRTELYNEVEQDTILDDFIISLRVAQRGYTIQYNPDAYAIEAASENVSEELKRKIRISAGGIQSVLRLRSLFNIFKYGILSFQFISHRVLRWTLTPLCLLLLIPISATLAINEGVLELGLYSSMFWIQMIMYLAALTGWLLEHKSTRIKMLFVPYYFFIMNLSVFLGFMRIINNNQSVNWERAKRAS